MKLKRTGKVVAVTAVDYNPNENIKADYVGSLYNNDNQNSILFGQDDIEKKYSINIEEANKRKNR